METTVTKDRLGRILEVNSNIKEIYLEDVGYAISGGYVKNIDTKSEPHRVEIYDPISIIGYWIDSDEVVVDLDLYGISLEEDIRLVDSTDSMNGYPSNIKPILIGFDSFEKAMELSTRYGMDIEMFTKKEGQDLWSRNEHTMYEPFELVSDMFGDNYFFIDEEVDEVEFVREVMGLLEGKLIDNFEELNNYISSKEEIYNATLEKGDDEVVVVVDGHYTDTIKKMCMSYSNDSKHYTIGLISKE